MNRVRLALPAALATAVLGTTLLPAPAMADGADSTIYADGGVVFTSPTLPGTEDTHYLDIPGRGSVTVSYLCAGGGVAFLDLSLTQVQETRTASSHPGQSVPAQCDGSLQQVDVALLMDVDSEGDFVQADGLLHAEILGQVSSDLTVPITLDYSSDPTPTPTPTPTQTPTSTPTPPAPKPKASVALTVDASPEPVTKGKTITVKGTVERDGKKYKTSVVLEFASDGDDYAKVKTVKSDAKGALKTSVTASRSGDFRYRFGGNATTESGTSTGDHVVVKPKPAPAPSKPKPKAYKNCTALVKVYPHGVGKSGAKDKGGDVTNFTRDTKTYEKNTKSDRDKDGIACER